MKSHKKILIVDDSKAIRYRTQTVLSKRYITEIAGDGEEALAKLPTFQPDLILLDVLMPNLNGLETCRKIRTDPLFRFTKIMFVSANITLDDRLAGYEAGGDDYVTKPYDEGELLAKVNILLKLKNEEEISNMKSNFISLISHETRTPVNGILGCSELLYESSTGKSKQLAECILHSGKRLHRLIENVLLMNKLKLSSDEMMAHQKTYLEPLVADLLKQMDTDIQQKNLETEVTIQEPYVINGNNSLLSKALSYVIENAIKFSPTQGKVTIEAQKAEDECVICIADDGPGLQPDIKDKIFDEFAIQDIGHHQSGLGISLAITKEIITKHGGNITAENSHTGGAVFMIYLPLAIKTTTHKEES